MIEKGSKVIHDGMEKEVNEIAGEILILNDKSTVRNSDVCLVKEVPAANVPSADPELAAAQADEKAELRNRIEGIGPSTSAIDLFNIVKNIDVTMPSVLAEENGMDTLKATLLQQALRSNKIDPKVCVHCEQTISE